MLKTARINVEKSDLLTALRELSANILGQNNISAIFAPWRRPMKNIVMPTLLTDPQHLSGIDPLSPAFPMNSAKIASRLTRKPSGGRIAAILRPCEIRAFRELVKLKQGRMEDLVIIGIDCLGAFTNRDYIHWVSEDADASTKNFYTQALDESIDSPYDVNLAAACRACEFPIAWDADLSIGLYGMDFTRTLLIQAQTRGGEILLDKLGYPAMKVPPQREKTIDGLVAKRVTVRDAMITDTHKATDSVEKLGAYLANCVNCYNCRVACPVCYCRECVFVTDVFDHDPDQYLRWAEQKGAVKIPTDTLLYHITRMVHMSTACVGCGQCSNACPNDIPVMELFRSIARGTQAAFDYQAGRSLDDKPPMTEFREEEFEEIVGIES